MWSQVSDMWSSVLANSHSYAAIAGLLVVFGLGAFPAFYGTSVWLAFLLSFSDGCPLGDLDDEST